MFLYIWRHLALFLWRGLLPLLLRSSNKALESRLKGMRRESTQLTQTHSTQCGTFSTELGGILQHPAKPTTFLSFVYTWSSLARHVGCCCSTKAWWKRSGMCKWYMVRMRRNITLHMTNQRWSNINQRSNFTWVVRSVRSEQKSHLGVQHVLVLLFTHV